MMISGAYSTMTDHNLISSDLTIPPQSQAQQQPQLSPHNLSYYSPNQGSLSHTGNGSELDLNSSEHGSVIGSMALAGPAPVHSMNCQNTAQIGSTNGLSQQYNMPSQVDPCVRCGFGGGDVRIKTCGCTLHTRCLEIPDEGGLKNCPQCQNNITGISILPLSFRELDEAKKAAQVLSSQNAAGGRRKRKSTSVAGDELNITGISSGIEKQGVDESDQRAGRWTPAETVYVDQLIAKFEDGNLPIADGIKLNDFLAGMLQCKQSRLTKKMKNAKLSSKCFKRASGYIPSLEDAQEFSGLEEAFFHSIHCGEERAEMRFHMQKQWRELFSGYCVNLGQTIDADAWLDSVEEIERRASMAKDAARMARRKLMMGKALNQDALNPDIGVIIDQSGCDPGNLSLPVSSSVDSLTSVYAGPVDNTSLISSMHAVASDFTDSVTSPTKNLSPYLDKIIRYLERGGIPFEHVDAWVPSFVSTTEGDNMLSSSTGNPKCRLCYAGSATMEVHSSGRRQHYPGIAGAPWLVTATESISPEEHFNLISFGEYSQKFSFDIGCGLPGRVYSSGIPTWEQSVQNAPLEHFERCGGAIQCGIRTVVGIPVPSPNVGRVVIVLYSCHDREKDQDLVGRLAEEFTRLAPTPRWKLIVDVGTPIEPLKAPVQVVQTSNTNNAVGLDLSTSTHTTVDFQHGQMNSNLTKTRDSRVDAVVSLLGEYMPFDASSPLSPYQKGFMSLRLLILRPSRTDAEEDLVRTMLDSYESYAAAGRAAKDIAVLLARDFMFLTEVQVQQTQEFMPNVHQITLGHQNFNQVMYNPSNLVSHNSNTNFYAPDRPNSDGSSPRGHLSSSIHGGTDQLSNSVHGSSGQLSNSVHGAAPIQERRSSYGQPSTATQNHSSLQQAQQKLEGWNHTITHSFKNMPMNNNQFSGNQMPNGMAGGPMMQTSQQPWQQQQQPNKYT